MRYQNSLLLIKPDAQYRNLTDTIIARVQKDGLDVLLQYETRPSRELILDHYAQSIKKHGDFLAQRLLDYLCGKQVVAAMVGGISGVHRLRRLCGESSDPSQCLPGTIRRDYGIDTFAWAVSEGRGVRNLVHSSETLEDANYELELWFSKYLPSDLELKTGCGRSLGRE